MALRAACCWVGVLSKNLLILPTARHWVQVVEGAVLIAAVVAVAVSFATLGETLHQRGAQAVGADFEPSKEPSLAVAQGEGGFGGFVNPSHIWGEDRQNAAQRNQKENGVKMRKYS